MAVTPSELRAKLSQQPEEATDELVRLIDEQLTAKWGGGKNESVEVGTPSQFSVGAVEAALKRYRPHWNVTRTHGFNGGHVLTFTEKAK